MDLAHLQYAFSYARSRLAAIEEAWKQWKGQISTNRWADIASPEEFDRLSRDTSREEVPETTPIFTDIEKLREQSTKLEALGATRIILHNLNTRQEEFIEDFGRLTG